MTLKPRVRINQHNQMTAIADGMGNMISALGGNNAAVAANRYYVQVSIEKLDEAYRASTWYSKIINIPADDATREWRRWQAVKAEIELIEAEEKRLGLRHKAREALIMSRHTGGAVIIPGGLSGAVDQPLRLDSIRKGGLTFLHVMGRDEITPGPIIRDPMSPDFGKPERWTINGNGSSVHLHPSRVILVNGRTTPGRPRRAGEIWGDSEWTRLSDSIEASDAGAAIIHALMHRTKIDVVKVKDFVSGLADPDAESAQISRWAMTARLASIANILLLDGDDEWNQMQVNWDGIPDVLTLLLTIMAGAADIPVTRLIGTSAKGLNATGDGDLRNYYDAVKARQELDIEPMLAPLDEMLIRSALGTRPDGIWYSWNPLSQPSSKELAEVDKLEAETANIYATAALVPSSALEAAVQNRMVESGRWPGLDIALEEAAAAGEGPGAGDEGELGLPGEGLTGEEDEPDQLA